MSICVRWAERPLNRDWGKHLRLQSCERKFRRFLIVFRALSCFSAPIESSERRDWRHCTPQTIFIRGRLSFTFPIEFHFGRAFQHAFPKNFFSLFTCDLRWKLPLRRAPNGRKRRHSEQICLDLAIFHAYGPSPKSLSRGEERKSRNFRSSGRGKRKFLFLCWWCRRFFATHYFVKMLPDSPPGGDKGSNAPLLSSLAQSRH